MASAIKKMIRYAVLFVIFIIMWSICSLFIYVNPALWGKIGLPSLPPKQLFVPLYAIISKVCEYLAIIICCLMVFLWAVWMVVNKVVPKFLRKMIRWEFSPFKELKQAGIFGLISALFGAIFSTKSVEKRFTDIGDAFKKFMLGSTDMLGKEMTSALRRMSPDKPKDQPPTKKEEEADDSESPITDEQQAKVVDHYTQCVQETVQIETPNMSQSDRAAMMAQNQFAQIQCKLDQMKLTMQFGT